jgi:hypothetical protein
MREQAAVDNKYFFIQFCPSTASKQQLSSSPNPSTSRPSRKQAASKQHPQFQNFRSIILGVRG